MFLPVAKQPSFGLGRLAVEVYRSYTHTHTHTHARAPGWTPPNEWSACRRKLPTLHTTNKRDEHACSQRHSNPRFQQSFPLDHTATGIGVNLSLGIPYSSVGTVTRLQTGQPWIRGSIPGRGQQIFSKTSRLILGPIQPPVGWALETLSPGMKRPGKKPTPSPPSSTDMKYEWNHTFATHLPSVPAQGQLYRFSVIRLYLDLYWPTDSVAK